MQSRNARPRLCTRDHGILVDPTTNYAASEPTKAIPVYTPWLWPRFSLRSFRFPSTIWMISSAFSWVFGKTKREIQAKGRVILYDWIEMIRSAAFLDDLGLFQDGMISQVVLLLLSRLVAKAFLVFLMRLLHFSLCYLSISTRRSAQPSVRRTLTPVKSVCCPSKVLNRSWYDASIFLLRMAFDF